MFSVRQQSGLEAWLLSCVWLIFGMMALAGLVLVFIGRDMGIGYTAFGALILAISVVLIWKTTRNYLARGKTDEKHEG
jgi:hypothetical protein